ncbi:MAG: hypothetical protein R3E90_06360 [Marinicella sp.]
MSVLLLQGMFVGFLLIHLLSNRPWSFKLILTLVIATSLVVHFTTVIKIDPFFLLITLASSHAVILSNPNESMTSLLISTLLATLFTAQFVPIQFGFMLLGLFTMIVLTVQFINKSSVIHWLILLGLVLCWLMSTPTNWLLFACGCWAVWQAKQLHDQSNKHVDHDDLYAQIEAAKMAERSRIYQNIHDDVGAELLQLMYQQDNKQQQNQVKRIMNQLRQAVASTAHINITVPQLLQEIATEAATRCSLANISFSHQIKLHDDPKLDQLEPIHLQRIIRELVNNCLKHAQATHINMQATTQDGVLFILLSDDGVGFKANDIQGKGIKSLQQRITAKGGTINWQAKQPQGTQIELALKI